MGDSNSLLDPMEVMCILVFVSQRLLLPMEYESLPDLMPDIERQKTDIDSRGESFTLSFCYVVDRTF
jgi:hypothetical protein